MRLLVNSLPVDGGLGGGFKRSFNTLKHFPDLGVECYLYPSYRSLLEVVAIDIKVNGKAAAVMTSFKELEKRGVLIPPSAFWLLEDAAVREKVSKKTGSKWLNLFNQLLRQYPDSEELAQEKKYCDDLMKEIKLVHAVYSPHECYNQCFSANYFANRLKMPLFILMQLEPFRTGVSLFDYMPHDYRLRLFPLFAHTAFIDSRQYAKTKGLYSQILESGLLRGVLSVSSAPLALSGMDEALHKRGILLRILSPANAVEVKPIKAKKDQNNAIYYSRIIPEKGLFDLPYIWLQVSKALPHAKLSMYGAFTSRTLKSTFFNILNKLGISNNVEYKGFVPDQELQSAISNATVFVYPSHMDAFPLGVLESLSLGTDVVTYDTPAIRDSFSGLGVVHQITEWNTSEMASQIIKTMSTDPNSYSEGYDDEKVKAFLRLHQSWKSVAEAEIEPLKEFISAS